MGGLVLSGRADACLTEDGDLLAYGCPVIWRKFKKESVEIIHLDKILKGMNLTIKQFQQFCILSGTDYIETIKGIGPKTALKYLSAGKNIDQILDEKKINIHPIQDWEKVVDLFNKLEYSNKSIKSKKINKVEFLEFVRKELDLN